MILSAIDLGTNTILMLTAEILSDGTLRMLGDEYGIARLGRGVDAGHLIQPDAFGRVEGFISSYIAISRSLGAEQILAVGTSALRDARNSAEFVREMERRTGVRIQIISGKQEAALTYRGALYGHPMESRYSLVVDIGGGSTEVTVGDGVRVLDGQSIDIGAVRITERFFPQLPPTPVQLEEARRFVRSLLAAIPDPPPDVVAVGVAGTITTLGAMHTGLGGFDAASLNGTILQAGDITSMTGQLVGMSLPELLAVPAINPKRADILTGGAVILDEFMRRFRLEHLRVSTGGLRYGVLLQSSRPLSVDYQHETNSLGTGAGSG